MAAKPQKNKWEILKHPLLVGVIVAAVGGLIAFLVKSSSSTPTNNNSGIQVNNNGTIKAPIFNAIGNSNTINNTTIFNQQPTNNIIPALPFVRIETLDGLPEGMTNNPHLRLNRLVIENSSEVEIDNICSRLQLPEPITFTVETNQPGGIMVGWRPLLDRILIKGTGGRNWIGGGSKVTWMDASPCFFSTNYVGEKGTISKDGDLTGVWELTIDKLPPQRSVSLLFMTSDDTEAANYINFVSVPLWKSPPHPSTIQDTNELLFSFEGRYQYQGGVKSADQDFIVPLIFNSDQRTISSLGIQSEVGRWHPIFISFQ